MAQPRLRPFKTQIQAAGARGVGLKFDMLDALRSWLGSGGKPVEPEAAERRAKICIGCQLNCAPTWLEEHATEPVAEAIRSMLEVKNKMQISTFHDENLHLCKMCGCSLKLKVHTPLEHVLKSFPYIGSLDTAPDYCWMKTER